MNNIKMIRASVDFALTQKCSDKKAPKYAPDKVVDGFLRFAKTLDSSWRIVLNGEKSLLHPRFFEIIKSLKTCDVKIAISTDFSLPIEKYKKIVDTLNANLVEFTILYNPHQTGCINQFLGKIYEFDKYKNQNAFIKVSSKLTQDSYKELYFISEELKKHSICFELQSSDTQYSKDVEHFYTRYLKKVFLPTETFGKMCHSGLKYLTINTDGSTYRCCPTRFVKKHMLKNIQDPRFKLFKNPSPCLLKNCTCEKAIECGVLDATSENTAKALLNTALNLLNLPILVVKNSGIINKRDFTIK